LQIGMRTLSRRTHSFLRARLNALASPPKHGKTGEREQALRNWVETDVLSLVALAQHHGMPTQLLDWTWSPFCATYFAAVTAAKNFKDGKDGRLCVWALSLAPFEMGLSVSPGDRQNEGYRVFEIVTVPTASNAPLHAQEGLFTYVHHLDDLIDLDGAVNRDAFDTLLNQKLFESLGRTLLYRFTLPLPQSPELLRLVAQLGASAGKYDPTLWGAKKELEERHLWDRPPW
jgi:hypothetical protein